MEKLKKFAERCINTEIFWNIAVFVVTLAAFLPILQVSELISDDLFYYQNAAAAGGDLRMIFAPVIGLSTPLTSLSFYVDTLIWGEKYFIPGGHFVNILLHAGVGVIFYNLTRTLTWKKSDGSEIKLSPSWAGMVTLIFTLHPQRVESAAWLAERKDVLAMLLGLAALWLFLLAARKNKVSWCSAGLLCLSLLAKPMWVFFFLPAAALLWMDDRCWQWKKFLKLLAPGLAVFVFLVIWQSGGVLQSVDKSLSSGGVPLLFKLETILFNYGSYFARTFVPGTLFPVYPYYNPALDPRWLALLPFMLMIGTAAAFRKPEFRAGVLYGIFPALLCFAVILVPVVGFSRVGSTDFADRYSYLPSIFLLWAVAFLLRINLPKETEFGKWLPVLGVLYCGGLLWQTEKYLPAWYSNSAFAEFSIRHPEPNFNMAISAAVREYYAGRYDKALQICQEKLPESSRYPEDFNIVIKVFKLAMQGLVLFKQGKPDHGIQYLNTIYMSKYSGMVRNFPIDFAQHTFTTGAEYHLKRYNNRQGAANLYHRCAVLFAFHSPVYGAFYSGMEALTLGDHARAVRCFEEAARYDFLREACLRNLNIARQALERKKK